MPHVRVFLHNSSDYYFMFCCQKVWNVYNNKMIGAISGANWILSEYRKPFAKNMKCVKWNIKFQAFARTQSKQILDFFLWLRRQQTWLQTALCIIFSDLPIFLGWLTERTFNLPDVTNLLPSSWTWHWTSTKRNETN